jgi:hypothetical protein
MQLTLGSFKGLRVAGTLVLLATGMAMGLLYWSSVTTRHQYLTSRNFRLLTVLAAQVQRTIEVQVRIVQGFVPDRSRVQARVRRARSLTEALQAIPALQHSEVITAPPPGKVATQALARYRMETDAGRTWLRVAVFANKTADQPLLDMRLRAAEILTRVFGPKLSQGAFDTLVLATREGRVVYATGRRGEEVQWSELGTLLRRHKSVNGATFSELARTTSVDDVVIAGVDYKMFMQPCCGATLSEAGAPSDGTRGGAMIVAGLVESASLDSNARTISPTVVLAGIALVLLAVVSWPFLKLSLLGERQRISVVDVVQLATCTILGLALATTIALTMVAYLRLSADVDDQLEGFANSLNAHLTMELRQAYAQLTCMQRLLIDHEPDLIPHAADRTHCGTKDDPNPPYPFFDTFALISRDGQQVVKASPGSRVSAALDVGDRQYFDAVRKGNGWRNVSVCPKGCFVEAVRSWTTGDQRAVLSAPTGNDERPVAALSIPLRSMIGVVLPVGFQFSIIDENHKVVFHSDAERNGYEDFVTEADRNRRLRAVLAARSAGALNINYWGRAHRAYVQPSVVPHWSIVTLHDKESTRGLNVESTALTVLFLVIYMSVWVVAVFAALRTGAAWLWPDPHRRMQYWLLVGLYVGCLGLFGATVQWGETSAWLWVGFAVAPAAWLVTAIVLRSRGSARLDRRRPQSPIAAYTSMGSLLLVLTGVVPAAAFVAKAHDVNLESYVKHRQLELARAMAGRPGGVACDQNSRRPANWAAGIDQYFAFFYRTQLACIPAESPRREPPAHHGSEILVALLEDYMPYYGEFSVGMRELLHARAGDGSWTSRRMDGGELELTMPALTARSEVPSFRSAIVPEGSERPSDVNLPHHRHAMYFVPVFLATIGLALGVLVRAIVRFTLGHIFLAQVCESFVARRRRRTVPEMETSDLPADLRPGGWRRVVRPPLESVLVQEGLASPFVKRVCDDIRASRLYSEGALTRDQILDEIEERTSSFYARVWSTCSSDEKLVLGHVAQQGLANAASRRVVRRLLVRGLLFKDPSLRLMNETFKRFVLSTPCRAEVASVEGEADPSTWDRLRLPLALGAASAGAFLFVTQREVFDSTLTTVAGVTAAVPTVIRLAQLVMDRRLNASQDAKA